MVKNSNKKETGGEPTTVPFDSVWVTPQSHSVVLRRSDQHRPAVTVESTSLH